MNNFGIPADIPGVALATFRFCVLQAPGPARPDSPFRSGNKYGGQWPPYPL
jgi:hypothetical protein